MTGSFGTLLPDRAQKRGPFRGPPGTAPPFPDQDDFPVRQAAGLLFQHPVAGHTVRRFGRIAGHHAKTPDATICALTARQMIGVKPAPCGKRNRRGLRRWPFPARDAGPRAEDQGRRQVRCRRNRQAACKRSCRRSATRAEPDPMITARVSVLRASMPCGEELTAACPLRSVHCGTSPHLDRALPAGNRMPRCGRLYRSGLATS